MVNPYLGNINKDQEKYIIYRKEYLNHHLSKLSNFRNWYIPDELPRIQNLDVIERHLSP